MKLEYLYQGSPGHPLHPPLTDVTVGTYTFATICALLDVLGISDETAAHAWALALVIGLVVTAPTALTGLRRLAQDRAPERPSGGPPRSTWSRW